ncbi:hybrid sensor histidine kinase/response regulator [Kineococcus rhizosphaerae]|nr:response regulator [Kineococcus rhizosphaerae]
MTRSRWSVLHWSALRSKARRSGRPRTVRASMRRPVRIGVAALLVVTATIVATNLAVLGVLQPEVTRSATMLNTLQESEVAMVNQETGLRGFLVTRDRAFLAPYEDGVSSLRALNAQLTAAAHDDPELAGWTRRVEAAQQDWVRQWAEPTLRVQPAVDDPTSLVVSLLQGKRLFDRYRTVEAGLERALVHRREVADARTRLVLVLGTLGGLLVAAAATLRVRTVDRQVDGQLRPAFEGLREQLSDLAAGDVERRGVPTGPLELRTMVEDVNTLGEALRTRGELVAAREAELVAARDEAELAGQAKTAFLATMSHEIRTPLNAVLGLTDLLLTTELTEQQRGHLETVSRSGDSLLTLINDVLDFSKIESGELDLDEAPFDLEALVYDVAQLFTGQAAAKGLDLLVDLRTGQGQEVVGDSLRVRQVLSNLLANAIKFTSRGHVIVRVSGDVRADGRLGVRMAVGDTGIGIPAEQRQRIFRSFSQVDDSATRVYGGSGLGLAISQRLVQAMGGAITVDSEVGVGSTFTVAFPLGLQPLPVDGARPTSLAGRRVLVVDDNRTNLDILEHQLGRAGASVALVDSPHQALRLLEAGEVFDLCLSDQHMPVMSGVELARRVRALPGAAALPVVLLSSLATVPASAEGLFAARLHKPVHPDRLLRTVHAVLLSPPAAAVGGPRDVAPAPVAQAPAGAGLRVLIVEDHDVNAQLMQLYLGQLGHRSDRVADGRAGVEAVRARDYDVVLMDAQMPVMGGAAATAEIRALPVRQPAVIAVTASVLASDRAAFAAAGADDFLSKPVRLAVLRTALAAVTADRAGADVLEPPSAATQDADAADEAVDEVGGEVLDAEVVDELRDLGPDGFAQVYTRFADQLDDWVAELLAAVDAAPDVVVEEVATAAGLAHRLKGSSASLGAAGLAELCRRVEGVDALPPAERTSLLEELPREAARVRGAVRALLAEVPVGA